MTFKRATRRVCGTVDPNDAKRVCTVAIGSHQLAADASTFLALGTPIHIGADGRRWTRHGVWTGRVSYAPDATPEREEQAEDGQ